MNLTDAGPTRGASEEPVAVVGLGASAGGVSVVQQFFSEMPADSDLAFVVVMHLMPEHESNLARIIQQKTAMPVTQVNEAVKVKANNVYVIPPDKQLVIADDTLQLIEAQQDLGRRVTIDLFFRTLAQAWGHRSVAVILSGSGADGASGLKHVRAQGGVTIAQDPGEAEHESMPTKAIDTGMVDWVLPVGRIAPKLVEFVRNERGMQLPPEIPEAEEPDAKVEAAPGGETVAEETYRREDETALQEVLANLRAHTGHDFTHYKRATVLRRIARRMQVNSIETIPLYLEFLRNHPAEARALLSDLLISVTYFFRDQESFAALEANIPRLFAGKTQADQVRVWVAGCASGEEAYSIAILLCEHAERLENPPSIQIFASDIDEQAIVDARSGVYPITIEVDVSAQRLWHYFVRDQGRYRVRKEIRAKVLFTVHNLLTDAPFSRIDLVSCRNLLIYLNPPAQDRVFDIFHFALRQDGLLFIGASESSSNVQTLFSPVDSKHRVYLRRSIPRRTWRVPNLPVRVPRSSATARPLVLPPLRRGAVENAGSETRETFYAAQERRSVLFGELHLKLLEQYGPPSVVVNETYDIVHLSENAGRYLQFVAGEPSANLVKVVRPELRVELRAALGRAAQTSKPVEGAPQMLQIAGRSERIRLQVRPIGRGGPAEGYYLILFEKQIESSEAKPEALAPEAITRQLDDEIQSLKAQLNSTVEQYEAANEELKASNEELQAMNEELQSATEELETSQEELQSLNEEMVTVNNGLKNSVEELSRANADLQNLIVATDVGTIFLDRALRIQRFTPSAQKIFNLLAADLGRPLSDITHKLAYDSVLADAENVLEHSATIEREVRVGEDGWFLCRTAPYRSAENQVEGVVTTFVDITQRKRDERALIEGARQQEILAEFVRRRHEAMSLEDIYAASIDTLLATLHCDRAAILLFDAKAVMRFVDSHGLSENYCKAIEGHSPWKADADRPQPIYINNIENADLPESIKASIETEGIRALAFLPLIAEHKLIGKFMLYYNAPHDFTDRECDLALNISNQLALGIERKRAEEALRQTEERFQLMVEGAKDYAMFLLDPSNIITFWSAGAERLFGWTRAEAEGRGGEIIFTPEDRAKGTVEKEITTALSEGRALDRRWHMRKDGSRFWTDGVMMRLDDETGGLRGLAKVARDATDQKQAEDALQHARDELEQRVLERTAELLTSNNELLQTIKQREQLERQLLEISEREKRRIGEDLHDMVCQELTAAALFLKSSANKLAAECPGAADVLNESAQIVTHNVNVARDLARGLQPAELTASGFVDALKVLCAQANENRKINCEIKVARGARVRDDTVALHLFRIAQESVNNALKHSEAKSIVIAFERDGDQLCLRVTDDGQGFSKQKRPKGLGLHLMKYRANVLGGKVEIKSSPRRGTTVIACIPERGGRDG